MFRGTSLFYGITVGLCIVGSLIFMSTFAWDLWQTTVVFLGLLVNCWLLVIIDLLYHDAEPRDDQKP